MILKEFEKLTEAKVMIIAKISDKNAIGIMFEHSHAPRYPKGDKGPKSSRTTTCKLYEVTNGYVISLANGVSACCPIDNFSRAEGRKRSLTDALKRGGFSKEVREAVWKAYRLATRSVKPVPKVEAQ